MRTKSETRRQSILDTAAKAFHEQGYDATSMSDVAVRLGGSKATLYSYFASKESLFAAVMLERTKAQARPIIEHFRESQDFEPAVRRFTREYLTLLMQPEILTTKRLCIAEGERCGFGKMVYEEAVCPAWTAVSQRLSAAMDEGVLRRDDPWRAAMHLRGLCEGGLLDERLIGCRSTPTEPELYAHADAASEVFLRAYKA